MDIEPISTLSSPSPHPKEAAIVQTVPAPKTETVSTRTSHRRMRYQLSSIPPIQQTFNTPNNRFIGHYDVVYKAGWVWPIHIDVNVYMIDGVLYAKVTNDTYGVNETHTLIPVPGKENQFTVQGMDNSLVEFKLDAKGKVKKLILDLPKYGHLEGKPK